MLLEVLLGNTLQYLSKIKSDLHETFRICHDWSPEIIINICGHAWAHIHAQRIEMCMQLQVVKKPLYFRYMKKIVWKHG